MRRYIPAVLVVIAVEFIISPLGGRVFNHFFPQERGFGAMMPDIPIYQWGYASILALGIVLGVAIERWRARRVRPASAPSGVNMPGGVTPDIDSAVPTPVAPLANEAELFIAEHHCYVSKIAVNCDKLNDDLYLTITITAYNAYSEHINLDTTEGHVVFNRTANRSAVADSVRDLPTPRLIARKHIPPYTEFSLALEQRVPREVADAVLNVTRTDKVQLRLDELDVLVRPVSMKGDAVRLPLWEGVALYREDGKILAGRMKAFRAVAAIGGSG